MDSIDGWASMATSTDVPGPSADLYDGVVRIANASPVWLQAVADIGTEAGIVVLALLWLGVWWRARRQSARIMTFTLLAPIGAVLAYVFSEVVKVMVSEERPCRGGNTIIAECPEPGDWSFPSNHSVISAALAVCIFLAWRRLAAVAIPIAVLVACSRVIVGVHYPHDVLVGSLVGAGITAGIAFSLVGVAQPLIAQLRIRLPQPLRWLLMDTDRTYPPAYGRASVEPDYGQPVEPDHRQSRRQHY